MAVFAPASESSLHPSTPSSPIPVKITAKIFILFAKGTKDLNIADDFYKLKIQHNDMIEKWSGQLDDLIGKMEKLGS